MEAFEARLAFAAPSAGFAHRLVDSPSSRVEKLVEIAEAQGAALNCGAAGAHLLPLTAPVPCQ